MNMINIFCRLGAFFVMVMLTNFNAQQVHVKYKFVRSPFAVLKEDLYIKDGKVKSIEDSIAVKPVGLNMSSFDGNSVEVMVSPGSKFSPNKLINKVNPILYYSNLSKGNVRQFNFLDYDNSNYLPQRYLIEDNVVKPDWKIDEKNTKKIAGYTCTKATAYFRGSNITAYFAKDLPYSTGPFKFYGLPGLILDVRVDGLAYYIWVAEEVSTNDVNFIDYQPNAKGSKEITIREFVEKNDVFANKNNEVIQKNLPFGVNLENKHRSGIEKRYEWE